MKKILFILLFSIVYSNVHTQLLPLPKREIKSYFLSKRIANLAVSAGTDFVWTNNDVVQGTEITKAANNLDFIISPSGGLTKTYRITLNTSYVTGNVIDFGLAGGGSVTQTINGITVPVNTQFGNGASLFPVNVGNNEGGSGIINYSITANVPIIFKVRVFAAGVGAVIGSAGANRCPTIEIQEL